MNSCQGWIGKVGNDTYNHRFGGSSWKVIDPETDSQVTRPSLLLTLDLRDPRLKSLLRIDLEEIPLCSHLNCSIFAGVQVFEINFSNHLVTLVKRHEIVEFEMWQSQIPIDLPEKPLQLVPMEKEDCPENDEDYWIASERFLDGTSLIRILGNPLWMELEEKPMCCGKPMQYVAAISQEKDGVQNYITGHEFYIGESVLYFFVCTHCFLTKTICQSV